jgi:hypothetical protein
MTPFHLYLYGPARGPLPSSFEQAESRLRQLPLLHFEPDGSFVWTRDSGRQQIDGMLYDAAGQIQYCVLQGRCTVETWKTLLKAIAGESQAGGLEVLRLPDRRLQDLQTFETELSATP